MNKQRIELTFLQVFYLNKKIIVFDDFLLLSEFGIFKEGTSPYLILKLILLNANPLL